LDKKFPGIFENECGGQIIEKFYGLRATLCAYKMYIKRMVKMEKQRRDAWVLRRPLLKQPLALIIMKTVFCFFFAKRTNAKNECDS